MIIFVHNKNGRIDRMKWTTYGINETKTLQSKKKQNAEKEIAQYVNNLTKY